MKESRDSNRRPAQNISEKNPEKEKKTRNRKTEEPGSVGLGHHAPRGLAWVAHGAQHGLGSSLSVSGFFFFFSSLSGFFWVLL